LLSKLEAGGRRQEAGGLRQEAGGGKLEALFNCFPFCLGRMQMLDFTFSLHASGLTLQAENV